MKSINTLNCPTVTVNCFLLMLTGEGAGTKMMAGGYGVMDRKEVSGSFEFLPGPDWTTEEKY